MNVMFAVVFSNLVWGLAPVLAKVGLKEIDDLSFLAVRFGISTLLLSPIVLRSLRKIRKISWPMLAMGIATVTLHYYLQVVALRQIPVTWYVFFYSLCPILNLFAVGSGLTYRSSIVALLAIVGTCLFVDFSNVPGLSVLSLSILIASVLSWVAFTWIVKNWQSVLSDSEVSATSSALSFLIFAIWKGFDSNPFFDHWSYQATSVTVLLAILLPAAFYAYSFSLRRNPDIAVLGQYIEPVFGTIGSMFFLGETLSMRQWNGILLMAFAIAILSKQERAGAEAELI